MDKLSRMHALATDSSGSSRNQVPIRRSNTIAAQALPSTGKWPGGHLRSRPAGRSAGEVNLNSRFFLPGLRCSDIASYCPLLGERSSGLDGRESLLVKPRGLSLRGRPRDIRTERVVFFSVHALQSQMQESSQYELSGPGVPTSREGKSLVDTIRSSMQRISRRD
jgi:hypothetical protein